MFHDHPIYTNVCSDLGIYPDNIAPLHEMRMQDFYKQGKIKDLRLRGPIVKRVDVPKWYLKNRPVEDVDVTGLFYPEKGTRE